MGDKQHRLTDAILQASVAKDIGVTANQVHIEKLEFIGKNIDIDKIVFYLLNFLVHIGGAAEGENYQCILKIIAVDYRVGRAKESERKVYVAKYMSMLAARVDRMRKVNYFTAKYKY
jgi:hypothetical protein